MKGGLHRYCISKEHHLSSRARAGLQQSRFIKGKRRDLVNCPFINALKPLVPQISDTGALQAHVVFSRSLASQYISSG